jgi:malonyl CoA-acyl carrier protein transacylase
MNISIQRGKTILLFPGLDAVLVPAKVHRWLDSPAICRMLERGSACLSNITGEKESLSDFFAAMRRPTEVDQDRILIGLIAIQYAIALETAKHTDFDLVVGCSHGDLARLVFAECLSLEDMIRLAFVSSRLRAHCPPGVNASVRSRGGRLSREQLAWLEAQDVTISHWTRHHATVAGAEATVRDVMERALKRDIKMHVLLEVPVHSPLMQPVVERALAMADGIDLAEPKYEIFSSVYARPVTSVSELKQEAADGTLSSIQWMKTINRLTREYGVTRLISVGPSSTLIDWMARDNHTEKVELIDAWDICQGS